MFSPFHAVANICRVIGGALLINDDRQIAAVANRIHCGEEDELVTAKQVLRVVLGCGEQNVDARLLHELVEFRRIEGGPAASVCLGLMSTEFLPQSRCRAPSGTGRD